MGLSHSNWLLLSAKQDIKALLEADEIRISQGGTRYVYVVVADRYIQSGCRGYIISSSLRNGTFCELKKLVPNKENRPQIFHDMLAFNLDRVFYAVGGPCILCYLVDIKDVSTTKIRNYLGVMIYYVLGCDVHDVLNPKMCMSDQVMESSFSQNKESRVLHLRVVTIILYLTGQTFETLCAKYVRTTTVCLWKKLGKTRTDTFSPQAVEVFSHRSGTKNCISRLSHRQIITSIVNAFYTYRIGTTTAQLSRTVGSNYLAEIMAFSGFAVFRWKMTERLQMRLLLEKALEW